MAELSKADRNLLNDDQQAQVLEYKKQWEAAKAAGATQNELDAIHNEAEKIRNSASYSGGASGNSYTTDFVPAPGMSYDKDVVRKAPANKGGEEADEVRKWVENYEATFWDPQKGWVNGYSTAMNTRSEANYIRQQMLANSEAWHNADAATRDYLHQQNLELAKILEESNGGAKSTYDPATGKWWTWSTGVGYGDDKSWTQPSVRMALERYYGYTDEDQQRWNADTSRYFNFVATQAPNRKAMDESSGYTSGYSHFANGPNASLLASGSNQTAIGNYAPDKDTGIKDGYGIHLMPYVENGVIQPNVLGNVRRGGLSQAPIGAGSSSNFDFGYGSSTNYIDRMYDALLKSQLEQLKTSYEQNVSDLDASAGKLDTSYTEQKRQTDGQAAQNAAKWREMAAAYGLNSGAIGQAALTMNNQTQSDLNTLNAAQAAALAEIERQRVLLGQSYQSQINQAKANNDYERANALYQEAVRQEEMLLQQQQMLAGMISNYAQGAAASVAQPAALVDTGDLQINPPADPYGDVKVGGKSLAEYDKAAGNYSTAKSMADQSFTKGGVTAALETLKDLMENGHLNYNDYMTLRNKYRG